MTTTTRAPISTIGSDISTERAMGMQLNIKNPEASRLANELAALTGESLTAAVTTALRERLERERRQRPAALAARRERVQALAAVLRAGLDGPVSSADHNDLYGPDGLPA